MATCPTCHRTITNHYCPDCGENERSKTRHHTSSYNNSYVSSSDNANSGNYSGGTGYGGKKLPATTGEIIFNVIAAIVINSIGLVVRSEREILPGYSGPN